MPSPYSYVDFGTAGDLNATQISGTFAPTGLQFVTVSDIYVTVTGLGGAITNLTSSQFTVTTSPSLEVVIKTAAEGGVDLTATDEVRIGRSTSIDEAARVFSDGSVLKASDLNTQTNQLLYSVQESIDTGGGALPIETDNTYNAGNRRIKNLGTAINDFDAVTLGHVTSLKLFDGAELPQAWSLTIGDFQTVSNDLVFDLVNPTPATAVDEMFLIEIQGVMQIPGTDYTVTESAGEFELRLIGTAALNLDPSTKVTVRNFGASRNILSTPFRAGEATNATSHAVSIDILNSQQGDVINAQDPSATELFRVDPTGQVIVGPGDTEAVGRSSMSTTKIQVGAIDTVGNGNPDKHGVKLYTSSNNGIIEVQGQAPASSDVAVRVYDWASDGSLLTAFKVTYGGALEISGDATVVGFTASGNATIQGTTALQDNVTVTDGKTIGFTGSDHLEISSDKLTQTGSIELKPCTLDFISDAGLRGIRTTTTPGAVAIDNDGRVTIGYGGNGQNGNGGPGSILFNDDANQPEYGPGLRWQSDGVVLRGFKIPSGQGGSAGSDEDPAPLLLPEFNNIAIDSPDVGNAYAVCKKQVIDYVNTNAFIGHLLLHPFDTSVPNNSRVLVQIQGTDHFVRPNSGFTVNETEDYISITKGIWLVDYSCRVRNTSDDDRAGAAVQAQHIINSSPPSGATDGSGNGTDTWNTIPDATDGITISAVNDASVATGMLRIVFTVGGREATDTAQNNQHTEGGINNSNYKFRIVLSETFSADDRSYFVNNQILRLTRVE